MSHAIEKSPKSYGTAVALCGVFGTLGIHHFYLGDILHGLVDLLLVGLAIYFLVTDQAGLALLAIAMDALHTVVVFYLLIVEKWKDGAGRVVAL